MNQRHPHLVPPSLFLKHKRATHNTEDTQRIDDGSCDAGPGSPQPTASPAGAWCVLEGELIHVLVDITSGVGGKIRLLEPPAPVQEVAMCEGSDWFRVRVEK